MVDERYSDLKEDFKETKKDVKDLSKSLTLIEKSIIRSESAQEKILDILANNKTVLDDNSRRLMITENLTYNLKTVTGELKENDVTLAERMDAMNIELTTIKEIPYKNYVRMKWIFYTTMAGSAWALYEKLLKGFIAKLFN